jgi:hypothetical protein
VKKSDKDIIMAYCPGLARQAGYTRIKTPRSRFLIFLYFGALAGCLSALAHGATIACFLLLAASFYIMVIQDKETEPR